MTLIGSGTITRKLVGSATFGTLAPTTTGGIEIDLLEGGDSSSSFTGESPATVQITVRKDTSANWASNNPVLGDGEFGYITDDKQLFVGDGVTAFNSLPNANFIVHLDDLDDSLSGINGSINAINEAFAVILTQLNSLDSRTDSLETASSTLSTNLSSESTARATADTSLQGQIDTLISGVMKKFELAVNAADIASASGSPIDIITPSSGKYLHLISGCAILEGTTQSTKEFYIDFYQGSSPASLGAFNQFIFEDVGNYGKINLVLPQDGQIYFSIDQPLQVQFTDNGITSGDLTLRLIIFYMEV